MTYPRLADVPALQALEDSIAHLRESLARPGRTASARAERASEVDEAVRACGEELVDQLLDDEQSAASFADALDEAANDVGGPVPRWATRRILRVLERLEDLDDLEGAEREVVGSAAFLLSLYVWDLDLFLSVNERNPASLDLATLFEDGEVAPSDEERLDARTGSRAYQLASTIKVAQAIAVLDSWAASGVRLSLDTVGYALDRCDAIVRLDRGAATPDLARLGTLTRDLWSRASPGRDDSPRVAVSPGPDRALRDRLFALWRTTQTLLARDLERFWPSHGRNEMGEANLTIHAMRACADFGMATFGEVPVLRDAIPNGRIDGFAFDDELALGLECKRLYSAEKAAQLAGDLLRLRTCHVPTSESCPLPASKHTVACVLASTWDLEITRWWDSLEGIPKSGGADGWESLRSALAPTRRAVFHLQDGASWDWGQQYLLAAYIERPAFSRDASLGDSVAGERR